MVAKIEAEKDVRRRGQGYEKKMRFRRFLAVYI